MKRGRQKGSENRTAVSARGYNDGTAVGARGYNDRTAVSARGYNDRTAISARGYSGKRGDKRAERARHGRRSVVYKGFAGRDEGCMKILRVLIMPVVLLALAGASARADTPSVTPLWLFGNSPDGSAPAAGLILANDGFFYGTCSGGGTNNNGTVFRMTSAGTLTELHLFTGDTTNDTDGSSPSAPLVQGSDLNFYGTTAFGGTNEGGVVFQMTPGGAVSTLWRFNSATDGSEPVGALVQGGDGNFYGTAAGGGANDAGTVFRVSSGGAFTNLYNFTGGTDGGVPIAGLILGSDGSFYGTTATGGTSGNGTVFKITSGGALTTLYSFLGGAGDGSIPAATLIQVNSTSFLGTTFSGGTNDDGVVFQLNLTGGASNAVTILHSFTGADGANPEAGLILAPDGLYYGTASGGGAIGNNGTIFRIDLTGAFTNLYSFAGQADGAIPVAGLVQGSASNFFGTCLAGGTNDNGTVFELGFVPGTTNVVNTVLSQITAIEIVGIDVIITIPSFTNQTYQLQASALMNPTNWFNVTGALVPGTGLPVTLTNFSGALSTQQFYRVDIGP